MQCKVRFVVDDVTTTMIQKEKMVTHSSIFAPARACAGLIIQVYHHFI